MTDDPQEVAESLDQDKIDDDVDFTGDAFGEGLADYPPDRTLGVDTVGVTAVEEDAGESFAERTTREHPDRTDAVRDRPAVGTLVDAGAMDHDDEEQLVGEMTPGSHLSPEESAIHLEAD